MNVEHLLRQSVSWEALASDDSSSGQAPTYDDAVDIPARKEATFSEVASVSGMEMRQGNTIIVTEDVNLGDRIDGEIVQARSSQVGLDGTVVGFIVRTEP